MAHANSDTLLYQVCSLLDEAGHAETTDGQLLTHFVAQRDERAFATLVQRHGPMVLAVARRLLRQQQDAEDVFQAAFLLLARKAGSIRKRNSIASWLHGVAYRLALKVRRQQARRQSHERQASGRQLENTAAAIAWQELQLVLDEALQSLPEKYRSVLVLCCLEDRSHEEAARRLGCPVGTVSSRLTRGRELLRRRLARRGLVLTGEALALALTAGNVPAAVPVTLASATVRVALQVAAGQALAGLVSAPVAVLVQGGMKAGMVTRWLTFAVMLLAVGLGSTGTVALMQSPGETTPLAQKPPEDLLLPVVDKRDKEVKQVGNGHPGEPLPEGAIARLGNTRLAMPSNDADVALSPDGKLLAAPGGNIVIWDAKAATVVRTIELSQKLWPCALAWSPNGQYIASMNDFTAFQVWDANTGKPHWPVQPRTPQSEASLVTALRFTADDTPLADDPYLAIVIRDRKTHQWTVELWDVKTGTRARTWSEQLPRRELPNDRYEIRSVALSPLGKRMTWLAAPLGDATAGSMAFVYETASGKLLYTVKDLPQSARADLPDEGMTLVLHPVRPAKVERVMTAQASVVNIADSRVKFHCAYRFRPAVWSSGWGWPHWRQVIIAPSATHFRDSLLLLDEVGMTRWHRETGKKLEEYKEPVQRFAVSANGRHLAIREASRLGVTDNDLASLSTAGAYARVPTVRFLPNGQLWSNDSSESKDGRLHVWEPRQRTLVETKRVHALPGNVESKGAFTFQSSSLVYYADRPKPCFVTYDLAADEQLAVLQGLSPEYIRSHFCRAFLSEDGKRVLVYATENDNRRLVVRWFDAHSGHQLGRHDIPYSQAHQVDLLTHEAQWFSADGSLFGYVTADRRLALVECATGKTVTTAGISPHKDWKRPVWDYESAGNHRLILARPNSGYVDNKKPEVAEYAVWDREGQLLRRFTVKWRSSVPLLTPDGRTMAVYSGEKIAFFETATSRQRGEIHFTWQRHPADFARFADISPDSTMLATSAPDATILLWDLARPLSGKAELPPPKTIKEAEKLWDLLGNPDPQESDLALWALVKAPEQTLAMMQQRLQPGPGPDPKLLQKLIDQLGSEKFNERAKANKALQEIGYPALPALRAALKKPASLEQHQRLQKLIAPLEETVAVGPYLRELRALEVLERIGTPEARKLVVSVVAGIEGTLLTAEARLVLARWHETTAGT